MTVDPGGSGAPMSERMQSLLSRAVEDQLSEQRQLAGVLADLRNQLQRIGADVTALRTDVATADRSQPDAALASVSADVREAVRLLGERLDGVGRLVQQRGTDLAELNAATSALQSAVRGHGEALAGVGNGLSALPSFGERIGGLQDNLVALHERLAAVDGLGEAVNALLQRVDAVDHGLRELKSAFAAIGARMAELPHRADIEAAGARTATHVEGIAERLDGVERTVSELATAVEAAGAAADERPEAPAALDAVHEQLARLTSVSGTSASALQERLSRLEDQLGELVTALTAEAEAEDAADAAASMAGEDALEDEDPVLAELVELREALLGEGGLAERLDAGATTDDLDTKVAEAVASAVAASEERLAAHIDDAVIALAEALLRRKPGRGPAAGRPAPAVAPAAGPAPPAVPAPAVLPEPQAPSGDGAVMPDDTAPDDAEGDEEDVAPWQTPVAEAAPAAPQADEAETADRRRRPWWRPGD